MCKQKEGTVFNALLTNNKILSVLCAHTGLHRWSLVWMLLQCEINILIHFQVNCFSGFRVVLLVPFSISINFFWSDTFSFVPRSVYDILAFSTYSHITSFTQSYFIQLLQIWLTFVFGQGSHLIDLSKNPFLSLLILLFAKAVLLAMRNRLRITANHVWEEKLSVCF